MFNFFWGTSAVFYDWLDELKATLSYRPFTSIEKAAFIYEQLGGEARQEIKYQTQAVRSDPDRVLDVLKEVYGQPLSLTKLQKQFFDRRQKGGESVREYSHALMAIMEEINHCNISEAWAGEFALRDQFAENVCDIGELISVGSLKKQSDNNPLFPFLICVRRRSNGRKK